MKSLGVKIVGGILDTLKPKFKILAYHSVGLSNFDPFEVAPETFEQQMGFLAETGYHVICLEEVYRNMLDQMIPDKTIVITFDDGLETLEKFAFPVLRRFNFPATVFLPVKYIGGLDVFSYEEPEADRVLLNWASIEDSIHGGISYGSHTMSHPNLVMLDDKALQYELDESKAILQKHLGVKFHALAYPFGIFDDRVKHAARQNGYDCALGFGHVLSNTRDTDLFEMKREKIDSSTSLKGFARLVDVRNDFSRGIKALLKNVLN
ncbi:MAG: polysaccharide deacetylase family protein [Deltaproteobacteria bacterium]|nr:polysaccharide deacetylase family protein [Deltaproteobacteria bacterium]